MLEVIRKRRSVRSYHAREVEEEKLLEVLKSAMFAPSSRGRRAWEFVVVRSDGTRKALSEASPYSSFVKDAPVAIVVCYDTSKGRRFKEDASICAEHIILEAVNQGLGGCFVQVAEAEGSHGGAEDYVRGLLGVPKEYRVQCMIPVGYAAEEHPEHSDAEFDESKVHREKFHPS
jgi:nitroreductase